VTTVRAQIHRPGLGHRHLDRVVAGVDRWLALVVPLTTILADPAPTNVQPGMLLPEPLSKRAVHEAWAGRTGRGPAARQPAAGSGTGRTEATRRPTDDLQCWSKTPPWRGACPATYDLENYSARFYTGRAFLRTLHDNNISRSSRLRSAIRLLSAWMTASARSRLVFWRSRIFSSTVSRATRRLAKRGAPGRCGGRGRSPGLRRRGFHQGSSR